MSLKKRAAVIALVLIAAAGAQAQVRIDVPIFIPAGDGQAANCSLGQIVGLDPRGDGFLSVRSGPGGRPYREIDRLYNGQEVSLCGQQGPWLAVVYQGTPPAAPHCKLNVASPARWAYTGPCRYGWIHQRYVRVTAG